MSPLNPDQLRAGVNLLTRTLCVAGAALAPVAGVVASTPFATDPASPAFLSALGTGALAVFGSWGVNMITSASDSRNKERLSETAVLLRNHDLNLLMGEALKRAVQSAAQIAALKPHARLIANLAKQVPAYCESIAQAPPSALSQDRLPNIAVRFAHPTSPAATGPETWAPCLEYLVSKVDDPCGFEDSHTRLAAHIDEVLDRLIVAVFKEDATGRGPTQGRGWAALTLLFWGKLFSGVKDLQESAAANTIEVGKSLREAEERLATKLEELVRLYGGLAELDGLGPWLASLHNRLETKLDTITALIGHGLLSPAEFRQAYWQKRRSDPGLDTLWDDPARAAILTSALVGRAAELAEFDAFLASRSPWVTFWKGYPGTGKSRLMIEFAERATAAGWRVFFVQNPHDLKAALLLVDSPEPVLLLWDDYQGENETALRVFLNLQGLRSHPARVIKRVITSWPTHNVLGEKARDERYEERELRAIVPSNELAGYVQKLLPHIRLAGANRVVEKAEAQPDAVLQAIVLLLQGCTVEKLPFNLLESAYDNLICRLTEERPFSESEAIKKMLLTMALIGSIDFSRPEHEAAFQRAPIQREALSILVRLRTVNHQGQSYSLNLDSFRGHIVRRSLDHENEDVLTGTPRSVAEAAAPFFVDWFQTIWNICLLASQGTQMETTLRKELFAQLDLQISQCHPDRASSFAEGIFSATAVEPLPHECKALADRIGELLTRHDTPEIALAQAQALYNATVDEPRPRKCEALADRIGELLTRHDTPEIALEQAKALYNAAVVEPLPRKREALADRIGELLTRHDTPEIALEQAKSLTNATVGESDTQLIKALKIRVQNLEKRYGFHL